MAPHARTMKRNVPIAASFKRKQIGTNIMKNKLIDLNDHLFAQIERLSEEKISDDDLDKEIKRGKALTDIADKIISNARLTLDAQVAGAEWQLKSRIPMLDQKD